MSKTERRARAPAAGDAPKPRKSSGRGRSFRSDKQLARRALASKVKLGSSKAELPDAIRGHGWYKNVANSLKQFSAWLRTQPGALVLQRATVEQAQAFLAYRAGVVRQGQLDIDRRAIAKVLGIDTERAQSSIPTVLGSRAYSRAQVDLVIAQQSPPHALATELAWRCGLRAHELATLRPATERGASSHRSWRADRFEGRAGVRYTVVGKGGLVREVLVPRDLHPRLEAVRLDRPREIWDRGLRYLTHYDLVHGSNWSKSFSRTARMALGWSTGAHGLRHSYAQARMSALLAGSKGYDDALRVVSQELGHFRASITKTYLR